MVDKNSETFKRGAEVRKWLMGEKRYAEAQARRTPFTEEWMDFVNQYAFGEVWARPGLDKKTRHMLTIAMLAALGKPNQVKVHVKGALANGVSREEIREILLHAMTYGGLPSAVDAFAAAAQALAEVDDA